MTDTDFVFCKQETFTFTVHFFKELPLEGYRDSE